MFKARIMLHTCFEIGHSRLLPNPFRFIVRHSGLVFERYTALS